MLLISNEEVEQLLTMKDCLDVLEVAYRDLARGDATYRPRIDVYAPSDHPLGEFFQWGTMEGVSRTLGVFAIRMKSDIVYWPDRKTEDKFCIEPGTYCGLIMLFSVRNAEPLAIIPDGVVQHMRVGACAGLGVRYMARENASSVGILGSGGMARTYLRAFVEARPIQRVKVYSPTRANRETYASEMSQLLNISVEPVEQAAEVYEGADIVSGCTDSIVPLEQSPHLIKPGMHITDVADEFTRDTVDRCDVVVRLGRYSLEGTEEGMQYISAVASYIAGQPEDIARIPNPAHTVRYDNVPSITDLMTGKVAGRTSEEQITYFRNSGTQGLQFAAVAGKVYEEARKQGVGRELPTEWFLQNIRD